MQPFLAHSRLAVFSCGLGSLLWSLAGLTSGAAAAEEAADSTVPAAKVQIAVAQPTAPKVEEAEPANDNKDLGRPTHKQVGAIDVNSGDLEKTSLHCFCLGPTGNVLAGCGDGPGEIRVFDGEGNYLTTWEIGMKPEAINVGSDGNIYVVGGGKLLKLDAEGQTLLEKEAPHVATIKADPEKIRAEVVNRGQQVREQLGEQLKVYDQMIAAVEDKEEADRTPAEQQQLSMLQEVKKQYEEMMDSYGTEEMTEEEIQQQVRESLEYKMRSASVSEFGGDVFLATGSAEGYGYDVWKMNDSFENGEVIVTGLSGCCGQMDVQCCKSGVFVAENSRHRVVRYDTSGKQITSWGSQARSGLRGFGSCCNPMNVAFGADGSVYTAEDTTGRIKRYSPDGELLSLVGKVDLVPGCKKVAIGVSSDGDKVYMLDITRNHIVRMERLAPGETIAYHESDSGEGGSVFDAIKSAIGL